MFRKYESTYRIQVPEFTIKGKRLLSKRDVKALLNGKVTILEKMDGANTGIIRHNDWFKTQKRGSLVEASEHEQFNFFKAWTHQNVTKLLKIDERFLVYGELMRVVHTVKYDQLPDWFLPFAIWDKRLREYLKWDNIADLCEKWGFSTVPMILNNVYVTLNDLAALIPEVSAYGSQKAEGIVIWNHRKQMRGKVVRPEFIKSMEESTHWMHRSLEFNKVIDEGTD